MSDQGKTSPDATASGAAAAGRAPPQGERTVSDPREVAALVMARMNAVNTKKDELTIAVKGLSDVTQQLARAYAEQMRTIDKLVRRVKVLEAASAAKGLNGSSPE